MQNQLIDKITKSQIRLDILNFNVGDTINVHVKIKEEGGKERIQPFQGFVLKISGSGTSKTFTVRKDSYGIGVERTFLYNSPMIAKIEILARGKVRRSRIYYMRERFGKNARIKKLNKDNSSNLKKKQ